MLKFGMTRQNGESLLGQVTRLDLMLLAGSVLAALILRELIYIRLFPDSIDYLNFAKNILSGIHHTGDITLARYRRPPLYPHMVALFSFGESSPAYLAEIARQVSIFAGSLLVIPIYLLGRKMLGRTAAITASLLVVITPEFIYYSGAVLTESLATMLVFTSMVFLWVGCSKKAGNVISLVLGSFLGLAFLSRHLVIAFLPVALVWIIFSKLANLGLKCSKSFLIKGLGLPVLMVLAGFFLTVCPQVLYLHSETGRWALAVDPMSISVENVERAGGDVRYTRPYEAAASLTSDAECYAWEVDGSSGLFSTMANHPRRYINAYISTLFRGYLPDTYPLPYPAIISILVLVGVVALIREKKFAALLFCLWGFVGNYLFVALFLNVRDRYMFPAYPFLLLASGAGVAWIVRLPLYFLRQDAQKRRAQLAATGILFALIVAFLFPASVALVKKQNSLCNTEFLERLGRDLSKKIDKGAVMFDRTPHLPYFSGGISASPPYADIGDAIHFARTRGVDYWVVSSSYVPSLRPQFSPLLDPTKDHDGLVPVAVYKLSSNWIIVVYRILPD
jgi:4-amino-4-deoxy-L-arabinose transferase-like glycosyltransferase